MSRKEKGEREGNFMIINGELPLVRRLEIPKQVQDEKRAGGEVIAVTVLSEHDESPGARGVRYHSSEIRDRGEQIDEETNHCKHTIVIGH